MGAPARGVPHEFGMVADDALRCGPGDHRPLEGQALGVLPDPKAREDGRRDLWRDRVPADQCLDKIEPRIGMGADDGESLKLRRLSACGLLLPVKLTLSSPSLTTLSMVFS
jgi:hypothetical protein